MNYKIIYDNLISSKRKLNRQKRKGVYYEKHHIVPKSLGGNNDESNLILLTAKEHFFAHLLLLHFTIGKDKSKMANALWRMAMCKRYKDISCRQYEQIKNNILVSKETKIKMSISAKNKKNKRVKGEFKHSEKSLQKMREKHKRSIAWNKGLKNQVSLETRQKMSIAKLGRIPWNKGLKKNKPD